jgi:exonuclease III
MSGTHPFVAKDKYTPNHDITNLQLPNNTTHNICRTKHTGDPTHGKLDPPPNFTGLSWNVRQSLVPESDHADMCGKLDYAVSLFNAKNFEADVACFQEAGGMEDRTHSAVQKAFEEVGATVYSNGAPDNKGNHSKSGVSVVVRSTWTVSNVCRHDSGRVLCLTISKGSWSMAIISAYMPSNLDHAPLSSHANLGKLEAHHKRELAGDLYHYINDYLQGHTFYFVAGDLNETKSLIDRYPLSAEPPKRHSTVVGAFLDGSASRHCDLWRWLHPGTEEYTRFSKDGSSRARLDYVVVPTAHVIDATEFQWTCEILRDSPHSDHSAIRTSVSAAEGTMPANIGRPLRRWNPSFPRIDLATEKQKTLVSQACDKASSDLLTRWTKQGLWFGNTDEEALNDMVRQFLSALVRAAGSVVPPTRDAKGTGLDHTPSPVERAREVRDRVHCLRRSIQDIEAGVISSSAKRHKKNVGELQALLGRRPANYDNIPGLKAFIHEMEVTGMKALQKAWSNVPDDARRHKHMERAFENSPRTFADRYLKGDSKRFTVDRHTRKDGSVTYDPKEYMRGVRRDVFAPMSHRVLLPDAHAAGRGKPSPSYDNSTPPPSTDVRATGKRSFWWKSIYSREAKGVSQSLYADLMCPMTTGEVLCTIQKADGGKSPGTDGCSIDLFKLAVDESRIGHAPNTLELLVRLANVSLLLEHTPALLKEGVVTLVPKVKADGSFSCEAGEMRPITLLPEMGKIISRVLAARLGQILTASPGLLTSSQRAFIRDGCVDQCVNSLVDVIEDWKEHGKKGKNRSPLFVISYDQAKAYDSVQAYTIRASLERFNIPESFIKYVLSGLHEAPSRVRTHGGLTSRFKISSSVRQGDPLAPLIYALITDALHEGLRNNPLFPGSKKGGYTFGHGSTPGGLEVSVHSIGYADDMALVSTDPEGCRQQHEWVREFFGMHAFAMNTTKTKFLCSDKSLTLESAPQLFSVDGSSRVKPLVGGETIRYLGAQINLDLDWSKQRGLMARAVQHTCNSIRRYRFTIPMSVYAVQQHLIPKLRMGFVVSKLRKAEITKWDTMIRQATLSACGATMGPSALKDSLHQVCAMPRLEDHFHAIRAEELLVTLNADYSSTDSCWARLRGSLEAHQVKGSRAASVLAHLATLGKSGVTAFSTPPAKRLPPMGHVARSKTVDCDWLPCRHPILSEQETLFGTARVYTDGSTVEDRNMPSGCASVFLAPSGLQGPAHGFAASTMGNNYLAETIAVLQALVLTPSHVDLTICTDSLSAIDAINAGRGRDYATWELTNKFYTTRRRTILNAARPIMANIRAMISARSGRVDLVHVKAHTLGEDLDSRMNNAADAEANRAREDQSPISSTGFAGEARVSLGLRGWTTTGSYRKTILFEEADKAWTRMATTGSGHQCYFALHYAASLKRYCGAVQRSHAPELLKFALLAAVRWLPCEANRLRQDRPGYNMGRGAGCKLCGALEESVFHALCECPARHAVGPRAKSITDVLEAVRFVTNIQSAPATVFGGAQRVRAWFDPSGATWIDVCPKVKLSAIESVDGMDSLGGFLGLLPPRIEEVLGWAREGIGWRKLSLSEAQDRIARVQAAAVWGGLHVWRARCRAMDSWFASEKAQLFRAQAVESMARRRAKNKESNGPGKVTRKAKGRKRAGPYVRNNPYPERPISSKSLKLGHISGFFVRERLDEICAEAEALECLQEADRKGRLRLPWY